MMFLINLITSGIINSVLFDYLNQRYEKKFNYQIYILLFIIFTLSIVLINNLNIPLLNILLNTAVFILISIIGFVHESSKEYLQDIIYLFFLFFLDTVSYFIVGFIYTSTEHIHIFRTLSASLVILFLNMSMQRYLSYTEVKALPIKEIILYFCITIFYLFLMYVLSYSYDIITESFFKGMILAIVLGHVFVDLLIYYYLNYVGKAYEMEKKIIEANKQIEIKNAYYGSLKKNYEENKKIIHDIKNYIQVLENVYKSSSETTHSVKNQIIEKLDNQKMKYNTSSEILDIILTDKENESLKREIAFSVRMEIIDLNFISELDIITVFGNLYDNAIEANSNNKENRFIKTYIYKVNEMIVIRIENSCDNKLEYKGKTLKSTKNNHSGIGTENINRTVKKYNGIFDIKVKDNVCIAIITFPVKEL